MKILLINTSYKKGSHGKIVQNLHNFLLSQGHSSIVCYGRGKTYNNESGVVKISTRLETYLHAILTRITGFQGIFSFFSTRKLLRFMDNYQPEVVHLFILHGYYLNEFKLLKYLKAKKIKTIYSMLDEYPYMGKCTNSRGCKKFETKCNNCPQIKIYPKSLYFDRSTRIFEMKQTAYADFNDMVFTGPQWVIDQAKKSSLLGKMDFAEVDEFTDIENVFYPIEAAGLRNELGILPDKKIVLTVSPGSNPLKGSMYFLEVARLLETENIVFIHIGYKGETGRLPANFIPVSYVASDNKLAEYYSIADLFVISSLADTMPNVCIESLSCGTPICGFNVDGIPYVATPEFGTFVPVFDVLSLCNVIKSAPYKTSEISLGCRIYAENRYSKHQFFSKVMKLYSV